MLRTTQTHVAEMLTATLWVVASASSKLELTEGLCSVDFMTVSHGTKATGHILLEGGMVAVGFKHF